jgi:cold shock CspA family protein
MSEQEVSNVSAVESEVASEVVVGSGSERLMGRVKWFNNRAGYGFITVTDSGDDKAGKDVFAHHSTITVKSEQYKYLVLGEYVSFEWCESDSDTHEFQAGDIRGVDSGLLMCETRNEQTKSRQDDDQDERRDDRRDDRRDVRRNDRSNHARGGGGPRDNDEWMVVRRGSGEQQYRGGDRRRGSDQQYRGASERGASERRYGGRDYGDRSTEHQQTRPNMPVF